jgi:hypothetical protein
VYPIGIEAAHPNFQGCSGRTWQRDFQPREGEIGAQAVRHITGRWAGDRGRDTINTGIDIMDLPLGHAEDSPYISTTMSFDWAFYELARRLTRRNVYGHVVDKVSFATINAVDPSDSYKGIRPRRTKHCVAVTLKNNRKGNTLLQESTRYGLAIRFAEASSECLYFGKIFDRDVYNLHHSTREVRFQAELHTSIGLAGPADDLALVCLSIQTPRQALLPPEKDEQARRDLDRPPRLRPPKRHFLRSTGQI